MHEPLYETVRTIVFKQDLFATYCPTTITCDAFTRYLSEFLISVTILLSVLSLSFRSLQNATLVINRRIVLLFVIYGKGPLREIVGPS
jgi:hypothetical protein